MDSEVQDSQEEGIWEREVFSFRSSLTCHTIYCHRHEIHADCAREGNWTQCPGTTRVWVATAGPSGWGSWRDPDIPATSGQGHCEGCCQRPCARLGISFSLGIRCFISKKIEDGIIITSSSRDAPCSPRGPQQGDRQRKEDIFWITLILFKGCTHQTAPHPRMTRFLSGLLLLHGNFVTVIVFNFRSKSLKQHLHLWRKNKKRIGLKNGIFLWFLSQEIGQG